MNMITQGLKRFRDALGYSQEGIADSVGMKQTTWSGWENKPPEALQQLVKLSQRHGVSIDYILGLTDNPMRITDTHAGFPERGLQLIELLSNSSGEYQNAMLTLADLLKRFENSTRNATTKDLMEAAFRYTRMYYGDEATEDLYRAVELLRRTGDDSALTEWFARYVGGETDSGEE